MFTSFTGHKEYIVSLRDNNDTIKCVEINQANQIYKDKVKKIEEKHVEEKNKLLRNINYQKVQYEAELDDRLNTINNFKISYQELEARLISTREENEKLEKTMVEKEKKWSNEKLCVYYSTNDINDNHYYKEALRTINKLKSELKTIKTVQEKRDRQYRKREGEKELNDKRINTLAQEINDLKLEIEIRDEQILNLSGTIEDQKEEIKDLKGTLTKIQKISNNNELHEGVILPTNHQLGEEKEEKEEKEKPLLKSNLGEYSSR